MLKNKKTVYFCQECGYESAKWMGQCPGCKEWNTFVEEIVDKLSNYTKDMSRRTYFRKRGEAVLQLGRLLWGYTTKECMEILERFVPE